MKIQNKMPAHSQTDHCVSGIPQAQHKLVTEEADRRAGRAPTKPFYKLLFFFTQKKASQWKTGHLVCERML